MSPRSKIASRLGPHPPRLAPFIIREAIQEQFRANLPNALAEIVGQSAASRPAATNPTTQASSRSMLLSPMISESWRPIDLDIMSLRN
jgi:hypothetical protein